MSRPHAHILRWVGLSLFLLGAGGGWRASRANDEYLRKTSEPTATCLSCHQVHHPVDVAYEDAAPLRRQGLRPVGEVVRRGLFLPGGRVTCHTCHDANSRWRNRIFIPPGSKVSLRVTPGDKAKPDPAWSLPGRTMTVEEAQTALPRGAALGWKPLCLACHALD